MIAGSSEHARKSAVLSSVIFDDSDNLTLDEKKMLVQAIEDHGRGIKISSAVGAALIVADKVDFSKRRILAIDIISDSIKNCQEIENVEIHIAGNEIIINTLVTEVFNKKLFVEEYPRRYNILVKAVEFLNCTCKFQLNGTEVRFE